MAAPLRHVKYSAGQVKMLKYFVRVNLNSTYTYRCMGGYCLGLTRPKSAFPRQYVSLATTTFGGIGSCHQIVYKHTPVRWLSNKTTAQTESGEEKRKRLLAEKEARKQQHLERKRLKQDKLKSKSSITYNIPTPPGCKKDTSGELPKAYSAEYVEAAWYPWWEQMGYFQPKEPVKESERTPFVVCLPPPNVTGTLHLGHALGNSIQDALIRWHRMCGRTALWVPGCDHAGIATQVVVEKKLWHEEQKTRHDVGRDGFVKNVWKWKEEKGGIIYEQMKKMGCSLDWSRERFTLDPSMTVAVNEAFIRLHDQGLIYRDRRLVNWSCTLNSAISDIEVDSLEVKKKTYLSVPGYDKKIPFGVMTSFAYPVDGTDDEVVVSTTRPETMLGDTAVAVHPDDARYTHLHGRHLKHPFCDRRIPIITDESVQMNFGTGAVKITPAHDHNDFEVGRRHQLESLGVIDESGKMVSVPTEFEGMRRFDARLAVIEGLKEKGLLRGSVDHAMALPVCSRSGDVVEPLLKSQWFVDCKNMADKAVKAVREGDLVLIPDKYNHMWYEWLENIRDWCISRQLWWGHRIPAYKVTVSQTVIPETWVSGHSYDEAIEKAKQHPNIPKHLHEDIHLEQDEDVLDTWFSSAVFPFAVFGWPQQTEDLHRFYPISVMETAVDILFFWVARMVMMGTQLTNQLPFNEVLLHGILRDSHGRKMSKSLGNVIDPMDVISGVSLNELKSKLHGGNMASSEIRKAEAGLEKDFPLGIPQCGADALRFTLCSYNFKTAHFLNLDVSHIHSNHSFCNKIWQAFRYAQSHWRSSSYKHPSQTELDASGTVTDRWILSRLAVLVDTCNTSMANYDLSYVTQAFQHFWKAELCDFYLEYSKAQLQEGNEAQRHLVESVLYTCFDTGLRCLAPFMPFLAEELYQRLPAEGAAESICIAPYPHSNQFADYVAGSELESEMALVQRIVHQLLVLRKDLNLTKAKANVVINFDSEDQVDALKKHQVALRALSRSNTLKICEKADDDDESVAIVVPSTEMSGGCMLYADLKDIVDETTLPRLLSQQDKLTKQLSQLLQHNATELGPSHVEKIDNLRTHVRRIDNILQVFLRRMDH